jgi:hypothetical protein
MAFLHARGMAGWDALQVAMLEGPHQLGFDLGGGEELGDEDKQLLIDACRAMLYTCSCCAEAKSPGGFTRDSVGCELCEQCYDYAGWENSHSDDAHAAEPNPDCPVCVEEGLVRANVAA